jgi:hypothetical protein
MTTILPQCLLPTAATASPCAQSSSLLSGGTPIATAKTDFLLQLDRNHNEVTAVLNPLFRQHPNLSLSAFNNPVAAKTFTAAAIEVNSPGGDFDEGLYRFNIGCAGSSPVLRR